MGGGWQGGRNRPVLSEGPRKAMAERSDWDDMLTAPMPPPTEALQPPQIQDAP